MTIRPQINYEREFGKHSVSALFFFERRKSYDDTMTGYKTGYYADFPIDLSMGLVNQSPYHHRIALLPGSAGFAGRISYAYDKKYLLEVTMRADGSYKFAPKNRWGYFPSVARGLGDVRGGLLQAGASEDRVLQAARLLRRAGFGRHVALPLHAVVLLDRPGLSPA